MPYRKPFQSYSRTRALSQFICFIRLHFCFFYNQRDEEFVKEKFRQVFMESVYPVYHLATLPAYRMGDPDNEKVRQREMLTSTSRYYLKKFQYELLTNVKKKNTSYYIQYVDVMVSSSFCKSSWAITLYEQWQFIDVNDKFINFAAKQYFISETSILKQKVLLSFQVTLTS